MKTLKLSLAAIPLALGFGAGVQAALNAVDPGPYVVANGFFPAWYQDTDAVALDLCLSGANIPAGAVPGGVGGAACTLLANPRSSTRRCRWYFRQRLGTARSIRPTPRSATSRTSPSTSWATRCSRSAGST